MPSTANIPHFPECDHALVQSLQHLSDQELVNLFQHHGDAGKYFTAIFCRYSPMVYSLIRHSARSPVQGEYLFALTWRHILHELGGIDCPPSESSDTLSGDTPAGDNTPKPFTLQNWLINVTALCINQAVIPEVESIHYALANASPPLWCYVEQALDRLPPLERLVLVMALTFRWSEARIVAYLRAEGEQLSTADVRQILGQAYQRLEEALPEDIQAIYLDKLPLPTSHPPEDEALDGLFDFPELGGLSLESTQPASHP